MKGAEKRKLLRKRTDVGAVILHRTFVLNHVTTSHSAEQTVMLLCRYSLAVRKRSFFLVLLFVILCQLSSWWFCWVCWYLHAVILLPVIHMCTEELSTTFLTLCSYSAAKESSGCYRTWKLSHWFRKIALGSCHAPLHTWHLGTYFARHLYHAFNSYVDKLHLFWGDLKVWHQFMETAIWTLVESRQSFQNVAIRIKMTCNIFFLFFTLSLHL